MNDIVYHAVNVTNVTLPGRLVARSARSGAHLWSAALAPSAQYYRAQTVVGNIALLPFKGWQQLAVSQQ